MTQKKIHQNKKRVARDKDVLSAQFTLWCSTCFFSVILLRVYSSYLSSKIPEAFSFYQLV